MSIFITGLAFEDSGFEEAAKMGVFMASILAGVIGAVVLLRAPIANAPVVHTGTDETQDRAVPRNA